MNSVRRREVLDALGLQPWTRRALGERAAPSFIEDSRIETGAQVAVKPGPVTSAANPAPAPAALPESAGPSPVTAALEAVPEDWDGLRAAVAGCMRCKLCGTRSQTVFGVGVERAPLMIVGEGPGAEEDRRGEPFVGRAGQLLDAMLATIGHDRTRNVFIANVVKCRPPGNRDPQDDEVAACQPYLERQIELVQPRLIVALGRVAAQRLLASDAPLARLRGGEYRYGARQTPMLVTYHPAYLLRSPREKAKTWADLKRIRRQLAERPA